VNRESWRVIAYRTRRTLPHRLRSYVVLALVVGALGGLAFGSIAAARRTQSAYPRFLATTNPSTLQVTVWNYSNGTGALTTGQQDAMVGALRRLPFVRGVERYEYVLVAQVRGTTLLRNPNLTPAASVDGVFFNEDRPGIVAGRLPNPNRVDEFMTTPAAARAAGWHLGELITMADYRPTQLSTEVPKGRPRIVKVRLVGLVEYNTSVLQDQADTRQWLAIFTPAFARADGFGGAGDTFAVKLDSSRDVVPAEEAILRAVPPRAVYEFAVTADAVAKVERALRPESIALGAFGVIVGLATLVITGLAIARLLRINEADREILRAFGASPVAQIGDASVGALGAVLAGCLLAVGVAVALSPIAPLGTVRAVYPFKGFAFDAPVLLLGALSFIALLSALTLVLSWRLAFSRSVGETPVPPATRSTRIASALRLPTPAVLGIRVAMQSGRSRTAAPARSTIFGAALAIVLLVTTLTFGSSLSKLASHPALYGWNWSYALVGSNDVPPQAIAAIRHDRDIAASSGWDFANIQVNGMTVPAMISERGNPTVAPPILSGHAVRAADEVVIGPTTLAELHKRVGDTVTLSYGTPADYPIYVPPTRLRIVGSATFPAMGGGGGENALHTTMGTGIWISWTVASHLHHVLLGSIRDLEGPSTVLVRMRPHLSPAAAKKNLGSIIALANRVLQKYEDSVDLFAVEKPAEIVNYRSMGATPSLLAAGVALGAIVALAAALSASVRTRRRELALLRALGFSRRQLAQTIVWQATVTALIGIIIGVPIGIFAGRWLWTLFAKSIAAVPETSVPAIYITLVALGAILLANFVAAIPGRIAGRTSPALVLHAE
jgi:FtsX-like permease family/MacB-like periplasmic core domain